MISFISECKFNYNEWGYFANSSYEYFGELFFRGEFYDPKKMIESVHMWNMSTETWKRYQIKYDIPMNQSQLFRYIFLKSAHKRLFI